VKKKSTPVSAKSPKDYACADVKVAEPADGDFAAAIARTLTRPEIGAAVVIEKWQGDTHNVNTLAAELRRQIDLVNAGDLSRAEGMLISQAHALSEIFVQLSRRAMTQEYLKQWEAYMRMAMKAQSQCRMTLETLATIKNPPVFARQANINNGGQQQVNNGAPVCSQPVRADAHAPAAISPSAPTELLEATDAERLDTREASEARRGHPELAPVGTIDRSKNS
jgi:hypothetical protein